MAVNDTIYGQLTVRDCFAMLILSKLLDRFGKAGYSDSAAITEAYLLANDAMASREATQHDTTQPPE